MSCRRRALVFGRLAGPDRTFSPRPRALSVCPLLPYGDNARPNGEEHSMAVQRGRHFLQIPGPTNVPDRILRAIDNPTMDHRGPAFGAMGREILDGLHGIFGCAGPVIVYPASGTGAWEAALVNTMSPGDREIGRASCRERVCPYV